MVVMNGQPFLQGNHSPIFSGKRNGCYVGPNGRSVYTFLKRKETVICMSQRNGTVVSEQALKVSTTSGNYLYKLKIFLLNKSPSITARIEISLEQHLIVGVVGRENKTQLTLLKEAAIMSSFSYSCCVYRNQISWYCMWKPDIAYTAEIHLYHLESHRFDFLSINLGWPKEEENGKLEIIVNYCRYDGMLGY